MKRRRNSHPVAGRSHSREYQVWRSMRGRCDRSTDRQFRDYGARGIKVCDRWLGPTGFVNFIADMGERPSSLHSIDRIDNDGPYSPDNCRWATRSEQQRNTRANRVLTLSGQSLSVAEWAERIGIPQTTISSRLKSGWCAERALTTPIDERRQAAKLRSLRERP
jgi:hypothetical protein